MAQKGKKGSWLYRNSLSIALVLLAVISLTGQVIMGWKEYNEFLQDHHQPHLPLINYLCSGHFLQATFENWESEFFQMFLFVVLTIFLRQQGSSESKGFNDDEPVDREPKARPGAPWAVRKGGWILTLYKHSLSIALVLLFAFSFLIHWLGSWRDYNLNQQLEGKAPEQLLSYLGNHRFWFESFQNWQSEFISVFLLVFLSIFLRQYGSPQSKPVDAPHSETGE